MATLEKHNASVALQAIRKVRAFMMAGAIVSMGLALAPAAHAEGKIRIAQQFGIVYLLLNIAQDQQLIEKHGKEAGIDIDVDFVRLSGGAAVNDALLSGSIDIAGAGVGPLFTIWDRTKGRYNVKGVASLGNFPYYLVSTNPDVKTIEDFTDKDRIAVPAVTVSVQSRILQLASAKIWGDENFNRLDKLQVQLPHPEATAALISEGTEVNAHFGNPPFSEQILAANPNAHIVLKSYDALGGPGSATVLYATEKFKAENPKTYAAFLGALKEAAAFAKHDPEAAADIFIRQTGSKIPRDLILQIIKNPEVEFTIQPENTLVLGEFLHRVGAIKNAPQKLSDYFFESPEISSGS